MDAHSCNRYLSRGGRTLVVVLTVANACAYLLDLDFLGDVGLTDLVVAAGNFP